MTEHKGTKDFDPNDPRNQAAAQTGNPEAGPGEPGHYTPPNANFGVTKSPPNEVKPAEPAGEAEGKASVDDENLEDYTVPELRDIAAQRGIDVKSDARKDEIIEAIKAG